MPSSRTLSSLVAAAGLAIGLLVVAPMPAHAEPVGVPVSPAEGGTIVGWGDDGVTLAPHLPEGLTYTAVAAGGYHSLALRSDGNAVGWGDNSYGQIDVPPLPAGLTYTAIAAGSHHSLGLRSDGTLVAWGYGPYGQTTVPLLPAGLTYTAIAGGGNHSLVLRSDGAVVAIGSNGSGQTDVPPLPAGVIYTEVTAGPYNSAALRSDGGLVVWGNNGDRLNDVPPLPAGVTYTGIGVGQQHALAVRSDGTVVGWGSNSYGQADAPPPPAGITYTEVAAGYGHSVVLRSDGVAIGFGLNASSQADAPASLSGETVTAVAAGGFHSLTLIAALTAVHEPEIGGMPRVGGALTAIPGPYTAPPDDLDYQWRANGDPVGADAPIYRPTRAEVDETITVTVTAHRAGHDDVVGTSDATTPVLAGGLVTGWGMDDDGQATAPPLPQGLTYTAVSSGALFSVALRSDGSAAAWGDGFRGRTTVPPLPPGLTYTDVSAGAFHGLALRSDGTVVAWGDNSSGQSTVPPLPPGLSYLAISAGINHSLALRSDGAVVAWGDDFFGETDVVPAPSGNPYVGIAAGGYHSLGLRSDGTVVGWGQDDDGAVTDVPPLPDGVVYTALAAGDTHSMALRSDGDIAAWGFGGSGQNDVPTLSPGVTYTAVAANPIGDFSLAVRSDATAAGWGGDAFDQSSVPVGLLSGRTVTAVAAGNLHSLALTADLVADAAPVISGVAQVGETLTVTPPTYNAPPDALSYIWAVNGIPTGSTGPTYVLGPDDAGKRISVRVRADKAGYGTAIDFSAQVGPVAALQFRWVGSPTITGIPQVGERLTVTGVGSMPAADRVVYEWYADDRPIGAADEDSYLLTAADAGKRIRVTVSLVRAGYQSVQTGAGPAGPVTQADWATAPTVRINGTPEVGETLMAHPGTPQPTPDTMTFAWYADGVATGDTGETLLLTEALEGAEITVLVTATLAGYEPARALSDPVGPVATDRSPTVQLTATRTTLPLGKRTRLTWTSTDATTLVAGGGWSGDRPATGETWVRPTHRGRTVYRLTATNANGTITTKVVVRVRRPR